MFSVEFSKRSEKELKNFDKTIRERVMFKIEALVQNPFPRDSIKIKGEEKTFRIRVGKYRILYEVYSENRLILITKIDKRERVYD